MAASSSLLVKLELPSKPVQELVKTPAEQVPQKKIYQLPNKSSADNQTEIQYMDSTIIDLSLLLASSSNQREKELWKLRYMLSCWGCFQLINHGLSSSLINQIREQIKDFFDLPLEVKQKHSRTVEWIEGYGNDSVSKDQNYDWNDRLDLLVYPDDLRNFKFWPEDLPNFRETLDEYANKLRRLLEMLLKTIAKSLNLEENSFLTECEGEHGIYTIARFNYYPPCSTPDHVIGLKPHSDASAVTILLQDNEVEGLQVQKDNQWFKVPIVPDALFINVGDQLEIMSNGQLKSVVHKVVIDKERERKSLAMVWSPHPNKEIGPLTDLIDKEQPKQYKNVKNYVGVYSQYFSRGERAITAMKI